MLRTRYLRPVMNRRFKRSVVGPCVCTVILLLYSASGCGASREVATESTTSTKSQLTNNEFTAQQAPASSSANDSTNDGNPTSTLTFNKNIAPIIFDNCAKCHRPGQSAPFSLLTYEDVRKRADQIADVVASRFMPPWLPEPGYGEFADVRRLTDPQIATLRQWADGGQREGDPADLPAPPKFPSGWQQGQPDLVLEMSAAYTLQQEGTDVFRSFSFPLPPQEARWVRAVEIRPGNPQIVHHGLLAIDKLQRSRNIDGEDGAPGFDGMELSGFVESPDGHLLGWTPGKGPSVMPENMAWRLDSGADLVLSLHMLPSGKPEEIRARVGLFFTDIAPTSTAFLIRIGRTTIDIPAGEKNYVSQDQFVLPVDVEAISVYPHAHYLAREMEGYATLPDGTRKWLIRINHWDFNWQDQYQFAMPVALPSGTTLHMKYTYDNSADNKQNPNDPPARVTYGEKSSEEMGELWVQVVPRNAGDLKILRESFSVKGTRDRIDALKQMLSVDAQNVRHHHSLGDLYLINHDLSEATTHFKEALRIDHDFFPAHASLGRALLRQQQVDEAIRHSREALRLRTNHVQALTTLGQALVLKGKITEAEESLRKAIELHPSFTDAHAALGFVLLRQRRVKEAIQYLGQTLRLQPKRAGVNGLMGSALMDAGKPAEASDYFREEIQLNPEKPEPYRFLAAALERQGNVKEAIRQYQKLLRMESEDPEIHFQIARLLILQDRTADAIRHLRSVLKTSPNHLITLNNLAWLLATHRNDAIRDGDEALSLAVKLNRETAGKNPHFVSTLAAALAEAGRFADAARAARKAVSLAEESKQTELTVQIKAQLRQYETGTPLRE